MRILKNNHTQRSLIINCLENNEVIVLPTDTIYGFSGKIDTTKEKIIAIKGRDEGKPFIVLIEKPEDTKLFSDFMIPQEILELWPGALTIILPTKDNTKTIALRCPGDPWLRELIHDIQSPLYSTSCNRSGFPTLTEIEAIEKEFSKEVSLFVEEEKQNKGLPSTIISFIDNKIHIIRQGEIIIPKVLL